jgi:hypothetical protein
MISARPTNSPTRMDECSVFVLTAEQLRAELYYDALAGAFTRIACRPGVTRGRVTGTANHHGYVVVTVLRRQYHAHRLAWLYVHGRWPENQIDHISGDKADNRIANLRKATASTNKANTAAQRNGSGLKGVSCSSRDRRWHTKIQVDGRRLRGGFRAFLNRPSPFDAELAGVEPGPYNHSRSSSGITPARKGHCEGSRAYGSQIPDNRT